MARTSGTVRRMDGFLGSSERGSTRCRDGRGGSTAPRRSREQVVFSRRNANEAFAAALYARTAELARVPGLFEACGIPDTLDGRFDCLALHAALMIDRLRREPDGEPLAQAF